MDHDTGIAAAVNEARQALDDGEVPIAAVVTGQDAIRSRARSAVVQQDVATAHAELLAIEDATAARQPVSTLYATLEPCLMCLGAAALAGISTVVVGMRAPVDGAALDAEQLPWRQLDPPDVIGPAAADEVRALLEQFRDWYPDHGGADYVRRTLEG